MGMGKEEQSRMGYRRNIISTIRVIPVLGRALPVSIRPTVSIIWVQARCFVQYIFIGPYGYLYNLQAVYL
jgi:hypothetical protein